jgi:hypothetical protein
MKPIQEILLEYENNRAKYTTIEDFIPFITDALKEKVPNTL